MVKDLVHVYTTPVRMSWRDAAWLGGALAVGVGLYAADQEIYDAVQEIAESAKGPDKHGYRAEFINLVRLAKSAAALEPLKRR